MATQPNIHVTEINQIAVEPARQYLWEFALTKVPGSTANQKQFTFRAMSAAIPDKAIETFELNWKSTKVNYAGRDQSGKTLDVAFWDGEDLQIWTALYNWISFMERAPKYPNTKGKGAGEGGYATSMDIILLQRDGTTAIATFQMIGAFPENLQQATLDYAASDNMNFSVTWRFDDLIVMSGGTSVAAAV